MNRPLVVIPLVLVVTVLGAIGQTMLKHAINRIPAGAGTAGAILSLLSNWVFYAGGLVVVAGGITWLYTLARAEISYAMPFLGMGFITTMISSAIFLHEGIAAGRVIGTIVIVVGMFLVARS
jgi:drug/metabolite transporter (DMT)-like permease